MRNEHNSANASATGVPERTGTRSCQGSLAGSLSGLSPGHEQVSARCEEI